MLGSLDVEDRDDLDLELHVDSRCAGFVILLLDVHTIFL
jgi:hypothetical protein